MGETCYTCDYCRRERNEIPGIYFCNKLIKSVLWNWHCGFYKHEALSLEEQELQDTIDKLTVEIFSQLGISKLQAETAVKNTIRAYDAHEQKKLEEEE